MVTASSHASLVRLWPSMPSADWCMSVTLHYSECRSSPLTVFCVHVAYRKHWRGVSSSTTCCCSTPIRRHRNHHRMYESRLKFFRGNGTFVREWGSNAGPVREKSQPYFPIGIAIDPTSDSVYVAEHGHCSVGAYAMPDGALIRRFGSRGTGQGQFTFPVGLVVDSQTDSVFVTDQGNHCVSVFRREGAFVRSFGEGQLHRPLGIALHHAQHCIYVADSSNHRVCVFDSANGFLKGVIGCGQQSYPAGVAVDPFEGVLYVTESERNCVSMFQM
jgi:DNA-binding beta-propeller fold protein YncE